MEITMLWSCTPTLRQPAAIKIRLTVTVTYACTTIISAPAAAQGARPSWGHALEEETYNGKGGYDSFSSPLTSWCSESWTYRTQAHRTKQRQAAGATSTTSSDQRKIPMTPCNNLNGASMNQRCTPLPFPLPKSIKIPLYHHPIEGIS